jgi:hypothetical protein
MQIGQSKQEHPIKCFLTFGNGVFQNQKEKLRTQAENTGWFDRVIVESPETIQNFVTLHKNFIENNKRGYGYWIWKPYIILRQLNEMNDGDFLFYTDSGSTIIPHMKHKLDAYILHLTESDKPILTFANNGYPEIWFQKMRVLKRFFPEGKFLYENSEFLNSHQVESGIFICRKTPFVMEFVQLWLSLVLENDYNLVNDEDDNTQFPDFIDHRHDQSILSVLCKLNDTSIWYGEAYGLGPFFSSRLTDEGPREFAPDKFRIEPDYDPYKHKTWADWLADPNVNKSIVP